MQLWRDNVTRVVKVWCNFEVTAKSILDLAISRLELH
jgi:hypothetical protein